MRVAVIADGTVENVIEVESLEGFPAPEGRTFVPSDEAGIGWTWSASGGFVAPAPEPGTAPPKRQFTFLEFMGLFTAAEQAAIVNSAETQVKLFLLMAAGASYIDLDDERTVQGVGELATLELITPERRDAVLAGILPA